MSKINVYGKSLNNGNYSNLNGMMTLSNTEVDGRVIITHVFEFNGSELQTKRPNAWRLICKEEMTMVQLHSLYVLLKRKMHYCFRILISG